MKGSPAVPGSPLTGKPARGEPPRGPLAPAFFVGRGCSRGGSEPRVTEAVQVTADVRRPQRVLPRRPSRMVRTLFLATAAVILFSVGGDAQVKPDLSARNAYMYTFTFDLLKAN